MTETSAPRIKVIANSLDHFETCKACFKYQENECMVATCAEEGAMCPNIEIIYREDKGIIHVICHDYSQAVKAKRK